MECNRVDFLCREYKFSSYLWVFNDAEVTFQVCFNGRCEIHEGGLVTYTVGDSHILVGEPHKLFTDLMRGVPISLYGQRFGISFRMKI